MSSSASPHIRETGSAPYTRFFKLNLKCGFPEVSVRLKTWAGCGAGDIAWLLETKHKDNIIGLDCEFKSNNIALIQIATAKRVLLIRVNPHKPKSTKIQYGKAVKSLLENKAIHKTGAKIWQDCVLLLDSLGILVNSAYDISSVYGDANKDGGGRPTKGLFDIFHHLYKNAVNIKKNKDIRRSDWARKELSLEQVQYAALDAIVSFYCGVKDVRRVLGSPSINTSSVNPWALEMCQSVVTTFRRLEEVKEDKFDNEFTKVTKKGANLVVENERYKTRIRRGVVVELQTHCDRTLTAHAIGQKGKATTLYGNGLTGKSIKKITVDNSNDISSEHENMMLAVKRVLTDGESINNPFVKMLFNNAFRPKVKRPRSPSSSSVPCYYLNAAQTQAVRAILDPLKDAVVVWGPPGTGKTTVIAESIKILVHTNQVNGTIVCTARSNIAVKNIAEVLLKKGFDDFYLVVSEEFYRQWHEHLYNNELDGRFITTANLQSRMRLIRDSPVILCTLATLSSEKGIARFCTIKQLFIDEASQTFIGNYLAPFLNIQDDLEKVVYFGDPKQLPPYGSNDAKVTNVFEVEVMKRDAIFLNIQYRMPDTVARFLSKHVYSNKLFTGSSSFGVQKVIWFDVRGFEEQRGLSFVNNLEASHITDLVHKLNKPASQLAILTGYDAQRNNISKILKEKQPALGMHDRVFNVDTFQGQEAPIIIVSLTRTNKVGFLADARRINVMLSRTKGMLIVLGHWGFVGQSEKTVGTLIGKFARFCKGKNMVKNKVEI